MEENRCDENIFHDKMLMLGFCPGFKPSREFLEFATKEVEQIMKKTHASFEDAVDDAVISILLLKKREFKKDHRVWLHKSTIKRKSERPCLSRDALMLKHDLQEYIKLNFYVAESPKKKEEYVNSKSGYTGDLSNLASCPVHKKDCNTWLHKVRAKCNDVKTIVCEWYRQNEWRNTQNKLLYLKKNRPCQKVQFEPTATEIGETECEDDCPVKNPAPYFDDTDTNQEVLLRYDYKRTFIIINL